MTLGEIAKRERVSGNRVQVAGLLRTIRRQLIRKVRQVGVIATVNHAAATLGIEFRRWVSGARDADDPFDCKYGTDTAVIVRVGGLDIPDGKLKHANRYEAVMPGVFDVMIRELGLAHEKFFFVDIGSGKGRALLLASRFPFEGIVGIEFSERLTRIALDNIRIFKDERQKCRSIHVICEDALSYELPPGKAVLYFYNPFDETVMRAVAAKVEQSLRKCPRKLYVVYHRPVHRAVWDGAAGFRLLCTAEQYVLYESMAE
jgi:SAM-dependent methyltransferase